MRIFLLALALGSVSARADVGTSPPPATAHGDAVVAPETPTPAAQRRAGDPMPLTRREPTLRGGELMLGARYGLVGTGPTRFVDDIRFGLTNWLELRTALLPYPSSLMARARIGDAQSGLGALIVDAGLAHFDAGLRVVPDSGEAAVGFRFHVEGGLGYARAIGDRLLLTGQIHERSRLSLLPNDDAHALAVDVHLSYDLLDNLAVTAGLGFATALGTPVREPAVAFIETDGAGMSHLLARDEGGDQSVTLPLSLTYGRVENFDVDIFCTPRLWPVYPRAESIPASKVDDPPLELGIVFGAGVRLRLGPFWD